MPIKEKLYMSSKLTFLPFHVNIISFIQLLYRLSIHLPITKLEYDNFSIDSLRFDFIKPNLHWGGNGHG
jgi:hypothetical protein